MVHQRIAGGIGGGPFHQKTFFPADTRSRAARTDPFSAMKKDHPASPPPKLDAMLQSADDFARREPARAAVSAFGAGFLLNFLPLGAIAGALVGIAFSLARPALLFLGIFKACELCRCKTQPTQSHE